MVVTDFSFFTHPVQSVDTHAKDIQPFKKGYDSDTIESELDMLLTLNAGTSLYYINEYTSKKDYWSFTEYCNMFAEANGNGFIMQSKKNERIHLVDCKIKLDT